MVHRQIDGFIDKHQSLFFFIRDDWTHRFIPAPLLFCGLGGSLDDQHLVVALDHLPPSHFVVGLRLLLQLGADLMHLQGSDVFILLDHGKLVIDVETVVLLVVQVDFRLHKLMLPPL